MNTTLTLLVILTALVGDHASAGAADTIRFRSGSETLAGSIYPRADGQPARGLIVLSHGSAPTARSDQSHYINFVHRIGFDAFAYDKRGCGESEGTYTSFSVDQSESMFDTLAQDLVSAAGAARANQRGDGPVGFLGGSQAGWIMPLAASFMADPPDFIVSVCGAAVSAGEEFAHGASSEDRLDNSESISDTLARIKKGDRAVESFVGSHGFDPRPVLRELKVPMMWIAGGLDPIVPTNASLAYIESLNREGRTAIEPVLFPGMDHNTVDRLIGARAELDERVDGWLVEHAIVDEHLEFERPEEDRVRRCIERFVAASSADFGDGLDQVCHPMLTRRELPEPSATWIRTTDVEHAMANAGTLVGPDPKIEIYDIDGSIATAVIKSEDRYEFLQLARIRRVWKVVNTFTGTGRPGPISESDRTDIELLCRQFCDGFYRSRPTLVRDAIHPDLAKYSVGEGWHGREQLLAISSEQLINESYVWSDHIEVDARTARCETILYAVAPGVASIRMNGEVWFDYMHLAKTDGQWRVVNVLWGSMDRPDN